MNLDIGKPDFTSRDTIQDHFWWVMVDVGMSFPVPLNDADLSKPFVYDRRYGVFYVGCGDHQFAMSTLLAWDHGWLKWIDIDNKKFGISDFNSDDVWAYSEHYLENVAGTCYLSSLTKTVRAGKRGNLNERECDYFGLVDYLLNG